MDVHVHLKLQLGRRVMCDVRCVIIPLVLFFILPGRKPCSHWVDVESISLQVGSFGQ